MKRYLSLLIPAALSLFALAACKNNSSSEDRAGEGAAVLKELDAPARLMMESAKSLRPLHFVDTLSDGSFVLNEREKMLKPTYLIEPAKAKCCTTLKQKYSHIGLLSVDKAVASLYGMPVEGYNNAINSLLADCSDPALETLLNAQMSYSEWKAAFPIFVEEEYRQGREAYFWSAVAAVAVEQLFVISRNIDKFLQMFTDEDVAAFCANLALVHKGIVDTVNRHEEMEDLNNALCPLYAIDATTVRQLKFQLKNMESDIFNVRKYLLSFR